MTQGQRLKEVRLALGLSQEDFGVILNIPKQMVSALENNKLKLNNDKLVKLLSDYNVNINYILCAKGKAFLESCSTIGQRINEIKDRNNLSLLQLSQILNITESTLNDILNNKIIPDIRILDIFKRNFKISIDWLLYGE